MNHTFATLSPEGRGEKATARSKDLATRERANFVLSSEIMSQLRQKSAKEQVPMSRMIDTALQYYLDGGQAPEKTVSLETGIAMSHLLELCLLIAYTRIETEKILNILKKYFDNFTYSRCAFKKSPEHTTVMGTKFLLFLSDENDEKFGDFLNEISKLSMEVSAEDIRLLLDENPIPIQNLDFA